MICQRPSILFPRETFEKGEVTGHKCDAEEVSVNMRMIKDDDGKEDSVSKNSYQQLRLLATSVDCPQRRGRRHSVHMKEMILKMMSQKSEILQPVQNDILQAFNLEDEFTLK